MKKFFSFFKGYVTETVLSPLFKLLEACNELIIPLIVAKIVDVGIVSGDKGYIIKMCLILVALAFSGLAFSLTAQYFAAKSAAGYAKSVRTALMQKTQSLSFSQLDNVGSGTIINTMTEDVTVLQTGINLILRLFLRSPFIVFGAVIFSVALDLKSGIVFVIMLPLLAIAVFTIVRGGIKKFSLARIDADELLVSARENLYGAREVRAFCLEDGEIKKFNGLNENLNRKNVGAANFVGLLSPLTFAIVNLAIICLIYTGAVQVNAGVYTQGTVIALYNYMSQILVELVKTANLTVQTSKTTASWGRVKEIFDLKYTSKISGKEGKFAYITFNDLSFSYNGKINALDNITLTLNKGERLAVIGGTGSGKSTLASLLYKAYPVEDGKLFIDGKDINLYTDKEARDNVALVGQKAVLFKGTLRENMLWANPNASDDEIISALNTACCGEIISQHGGLDCFVSEGGKNFSGGQRQRLTIARALLKQAPILLLDDSFSALDYATEKQLISNLKGYRGTIVFITQRISSLPLADKIVVLENGRVDGIGSIDSLLYSSAVFREIYDCREREGL